MPVTAATIAEIDRQLGAVAHRHRELLDVIGQTLIEVLTLESRADVLLDRRTRLMETA